MPSACQRTAKASKSTKFENKNNMAAACGAAVVSLIEELLADNSVLEEASSCEDDEFLFSLTIADVTTGPCEIARASLPSMCEFVCQNKTLVE